MTLFAIGSLKGAPGVTTTALAIALTWTPGRRVLLAELDVAGGDLAARLGLKQQRGILSLAAAARREHSAEMLDEHAQAIADDLDVLVGPVSGEHARIALARAAGILALLGTTSHTDVIADLGRLGDMGAVGAGVVRSADATVVALRPVVGEIQHLAAALPTLSGQAKVLQVVLIGSGHYSAAEISDTLGVDVIGTIPDDRRTSEAINEGRANLHRLNRSLLVRAAREIVINIERIVATGPSTVSGGVVPNEADEEVSA